MTDARVMAFKASLKCLEAADELRSEFRKQHPDPEVTPLPSDFWGLIAFGQVYATLAGATDTAGWIAGADEDKRITEEQRREDKRQSADLFGGVSGDVPGDDESYR